MTMYSKSGPAPDVASSRGVGPSLDRPAAYMPPAPGSRERAAIVAGATGRPSDHSVFVASTLPFYGWRADLDHMYVSSIMTTIGAV